MEFVERAYWESQTSKIKFELASHGDQVRQLLDKWVCPGDDKSAMEIGCVPGRYLAYLGTMGYQLNGIDVLPEAIDSLKQWFVNMRFNIGAIDNLEWDDLSTDRKYDLVCSFGFVEHFEDYQNVLIKHFNLVASGGMVIITAPNYAGWLQHQLHKFLDAENLERHNVMSMQPDRWAQCASSMGFEILYQGYFGYFTFWVEESDERSRFKRWISKAIIKSLPITSRILPNNTKWASPFCALVARKA